MMELAKSRDYANNFKKENLIDSIKRLGPNLNAAEKLRLRTYS